jgi:hypothetical protein
MELGVAENGVFYYGAVRRDRPQAVLPPEPVIGAYDPDSPDELNARRYFGFTDYEEIDIFMLRSRKIRRGDTKMANYYFNILKSLLGYK